MPDDPTDNGGFDDWLDEEPGPDTDPYAALSDDADSPETEIADWMAFTEGRDEDASDDATRDPEPVTGDESTFDADELAEMPAVSVRDDNAAEPTEAIDETGEIAVVAPDDDDSEPATSVDFGEWDGGDRADTDEIPIVAGAAVVEASVTNLHDHRPDGEIDPEGGIFDEGEDATGEIDEMTAPENEDSDASDVSDESDVPVVSDESDVSEEDDTGEMDAIAFPAPDADDGDDEGPQGLDGPEDVIAAGSAFGALWDDDEQAVDESIGDSDGDALFGLSDDTYIQTATREHEGLAAAIAEAEGEDTEQVAIAAPIPGLESTVVGFEDVVEAEGHSKARTRRSGDLVARVTTAIVLVAAFGASLVWAPALIALATVVFVIGAGEFYTALARSGRQPVSIFGFLGIIGATVGGFVWGPIAIPVAFLLVTTVLLLFYAVVPGRKDPMGNLALTVTVMVWAGLGAFAGPIAVADDYRILIIAVVFTVAVMDISQYFIGRALGRHQLAPWVSPKKTIEGLVGGVIVALALGALLDFVDPFDLSSGLALGASVAVLVPLGDLAMSAAKRSLGLKDMGSILPGHGGFLDRIDGLLFAVPAAWAILMWAGLL